MKKQKRITLVAILLIVLLMGIGYAAISNVSLYIKGSATVTADANNFKPHFTGLNSVTGTAQGKNPDGTATLVDISGVTTTAALYATGHESDNTYSTVTMSGFTKEGDTNYVVLEIINESKDIDAEDISVVAHNTDTEYIQIDAVMCDSTGTLLTADANGKYPVASNAKTYVKVTATVLKTPVNDDVSTTIDCELVAKPKNPTTTP